MISMFGYRLQREMLAMWIIEFTLCSLLLAALLTPLAPDVPLRIVQSSALLSLTISLSAVAIGLYKHDLCVQTQRVLVATLVTGVFALPTLVLVGAALGLDRIVHGRVLYWALLVLLAWLALLLVVRTAFAAAVRRDLFVRRLLVVGADAAHASALLKTLPRGFFTLAAAIPAVPGAANFPSAASLRRQRIWGVVIADGASPELANEQALLRCRFEGIHLLREVDLREQQTRRVDLDRLEPDWLLRADEAPCSRIAEIIRRTLDVAIATMLLALTLPVLLLVAVAIKLTSRGPVLYRQERVGLYGTSFILLKFRSMHVEAERDGPIWAAQRDTRVTPIGGFIRRTRIDELPQLLNVLRGDMRLVGPRPERPHFVRQLAAQIPFYEDRNFVKPGLTGWAQVNYHYGASTEDGRVKLSYDLYYLKHRSLLVDILILISTVRVIFFQEGGR